MTTKKQKPRSISKLFIHLESQARPDGIQRIGERDGRQSGPCARQKFVGVRLRSEEAVQVPLVYLERGELGGGIREYAHHLGAVALVQGEDGFRLDDAPQAPQDAVTLVVAVVRLQEDLDAIEGRHSRFRNHARNT